MITYEEVISLGWKDRWGKKETKGINTFKISEENGKHMLGITFKPDEDGFFMCHVVWVDKKVKVNEWENCDPEFYGVIKTKEDLHYIMRLTGVIEY